MLHNCVEQEYYVDTFVYTDNCYYYKIVYTYHFNIDTSVYSGDFYVDTSVYLEQCYYDTLTCTYLYTNGLFNTFEKQYVNLLICVLCD